jgi:hypothetical protein
MVVQEADGRGKIIMQSIAHGECYSSCTCDMVAVSTGGDDRDQCSKADQQDG